MKKVLMIAAIALLAVACNKNQKAVKQLDGSWSATAFQAETGGLTIDLLTGASYANYTFDKCSIKDGAFCNMTWDVFIESVFMMDEDGAGLFTVTNDGTTFQSKDDLSSVTINEMEILELRKDYVQFLRTESFEVGGDITTINLRITLEQ